MYEYKITNLNYHSKSSKDSSIEQASENLATKYFGYYLYYRYGKMNSSNSIIRSLEKPQNAQPLIVAVC